MTLPLQLVINAGVGLFWVYTTTKCACFGNTYILQNQSSIWEGPSYYYICALVDELHMQFHAVLIYTAAKYLHIHRHKQITYRLGLNIFMQGEGIVTRYVLIKVILTVCLFKLSNTFSTNSINLIKWSHKPTVCTKTTILSKVHRI